MVKISNNYNLVGILFQDIFKRFKAGDLINLSDNFIFEKQTSSDTGTIIYEYKENKENIFNSILSKVYDNDNITYNFKAIIGNNGVGKSTILNIIENFYTTSNNINGFTFSENIEIKFKFNENVVNLSGISSFHNLNISSSNNNSILYIIQKKSLHNEKNLKPIYLNHSKLLKEENYDNFIIDDDAFYYFRDELLLGALKVTQNEKNIDRIIKIKLGYGDLVNSEKNKILFILKYFILIKILYEKSYIIREINSDFCEDIFEIYNIFYNKRNFNLDNFIENNDSEIHNFIKNLFITMSVIKEEENVTRYLLLLNEYYFYNIILDKSLFRLFCLHLSFYKNTNSYKNKYSYISLFFNYFEKSTEIYINFRGNFKREFDNSFEREFEAKFHKEFGISFERKFKEEFLREFEYLLGKSSYDLEFVNIKLDSGDLFEKKFDLFYNNLLQNKLISHEQGLVNSFNRYNEATFEYFFREIKYYYKKSDSLSNDFKYIEYDFREFKKIVDNFKNSGLYFLFNNDNYLGSGLSGDILINKSNGDYFYLSNFSSGEKQLIGILNSLNNYLKKNLEKRNYFISEFTILLDEPEISLHIEWQRKFIYYLINGINNIFKYRGEIKINIILATHSPFIISDLTKNEVIFLHRDNNITLVKDFESIKEDSNISLSNTFLGNIPELLRGGFFLEESIGELGKIFLNKKIEDIKKIQKTNESFIEDDKKISKIIDGLKNIVGDEFILDYLLLKSLGDDKDKF